MKQYLENLIKVVNDEDWGRLKSIDIKASKLRDYLHFLLDNRNNVLPTNEEIQTKLKIDDKLHRKMKSVLLVKCYDALVPEGGIKLLELLSRYRLFDHFTRELEKQEKLVRRKTEKEKIEFYSFAFHGFRRLPYSLVDIDKMKEYGKKYLKTIEKDRQPEENLIVELRILVLKILQHYFHLDDSSTSGQIKSELFSLKKSVSENPTKTLQILLNYVTGIFHFYIDNEFEKSIDYLEKTKKLAVRNIELLTYDEWAALEVFLAINHYQVNRFKQAIEILEAAHKKYPVMMNTQTHVLNRLIELHMIEGNMKEAKFLLDNYMQRFLDISEFDSAELVSISYIKYYLLSDDLDNAYIYLDKARRFLNKKFYLGHDIEVRTLEIIYFLFSGDYTFAKNLITRGLKYLNEKAKDREVQFALEKYRLLQKLCKISDKDLQNIDEFTDEVYRVFSGYKRLFGILILKGFRHRREKA